MRKYIRLARTIDPVLPPDVQPLLVEYYVRLRAGDNGVGQSRQAYRITVRQLEALIRLSEAIARLHLDENVRAPYVEKAYQLLKTSIVQVESETLIMSDQGREENPFLVDVENVDGSTVNRLGFFAIQYVKDYESANDTDSLFEGVPQTSVVNHVLEQVQDASLRQVVNSVIDVLIRENELKEELDSTFQFEEDIPQNERKLLASSSGSMAQKISQEDLQRLESAISTYVADCENAAEEDDDFLGVPQTEIVEMVLENHIQDIRNELDVAKYRRLVNQIVDILIQPQDILVECPIPPGFDFAETTPNEERRLLKRKV